MRRKAIFAVVALAVLTMGTVASAHRIIIFRWWFRPPAPAIADTAFAGAAEDGWVRTIVTQNRRVTSYVRTDLEDGTFTATVASGEITIDPIVLSDGAGTSVTVILDPATLQRNFFHSSFWAEGTAEITDPSATVTQVPVFVYGVIAECNGEYRLRAEVRGLASDDDGSGNVTYTLFKVELTAATPTSIP